MLRVATLLGLASALFACSNPPARVCDPGATQVCVCPRGEGAQSCNGDGSGWLACDCDETPIDGGTADGSATDGGVDAATPDDAGPMVDADVPACAVGVAPATIQQITADEIGLGSEVALLEVVAMSPVFLVSRSGTTGSCLWGAFVSAPGLTETEPGTGLLVTSFGTMATVPPGGTTAYCPVPGTTPNGSAIPDDLAPGDRLTIVGETQSFIPSACGTNPGESTIPMRQLNASCVERSGTLPVPAAASIERHEAEALGDQESRLVHDRWAGVRVRITEWVATTPASPATCSTGTSVVDTFGRITLESSLQVSSRLYYVGALASSDSCHAQPRYCTTDGGLGFNIEGFHALDFCTWSLYPADRCADLDPPSDDCSGACLP